MALVESEYALDGGNQYTTDLVETTRTKESNEPVQQATTTRVTLFSFDPSLTDGLFQVKIRLSVFMIIFLSWLWLALFAVAYWGQFLAGLFTGCLFVWVLQWWYIRSCWRQRYLRRYWQRWPEIMAGSGIGVEEEEKELGAIVYTGIYVDPERAEAARKELEQWTAQAKASALGHPSPPTTAVSSSDSSSCSPELSWIPGFWLRGLKSLDESPEYKQIRIPIESIVKIGVDDIGAKMHEQYASLSWILRLHMRWILHPFQGKKQVVLEYNVIAGGSSGNVLAPTTTTSEGTPWSSTREHVGEEEEEPDQDGPQQFSHDEEENSTSLPPTNMEVKITKLHVQEVERFVELVESIRQQRQYQHQPNQNNNTTTSSLHLV